MDVFAKIPNLPEDKLHDKFKLLRDEYYYKGAREIINDWTKDFHDRDNKIALEFQTTFHSAFWEFYLNAVFKKLGLSLQEKYNRPDFIIEGEYEFFVEAVVSEIKKGGKPESERTTDDHLSMLEPIKTDVEFSALIDEAIVRHSNSIYAKLDKYKGYKNKKGKWSTGYKDCEWVNDERPYVIALSSYGQINYGKEYIYSMFALLYGWYYSPEKDAYMIKQSVKKPGTNSNIELGIFNNEKMKDISAIIFTNTLTLGKLSSLSKSMQHDSAHVINVRYDRFSSPHYKIHEVNMDHPEDLLDGLYIFHNPNAKNRFECEEITSNHVVEYSLDDNGLGMEGARWPIVARYCSPFGQFYSELLKSTAASNYNKTIAYDIIKK
ncbi:hypothetical protein [Photobacterium carnosum]|uniref:Glycosaminoglycan attachment site n=1 Tax=Photobacterium carnosum TaxID=2023717 RepID=A0A2N4UWQ1_9GAMM|nr:hypothetical protein [Photobacterium carnosum]PLC59433.1 hypothetical protein CIK00_00015 [Photobacterium carnosum]